MTNMSFPILFELVDVRNLARLFETLKGKPRDVQNKYLCEGVTMKDIETAWSDLLDYEAYLIHVEAAPIPVRLNVLACIDSVLGQVDFCKDADNLIPEGMTMADVVRINDWIVAETTIMDIEW